MDKRLFLDTKLSESFPECPAFFRPSGNIILQKPCIIYELVKIEPAFASNMPFIIGNKYKVTFLSNAPIGIDVTPIYSIEGIVVSNHISFVSEDIVHDVFTIDINVI